MLVEGHVIVANKVVALLSRAFGSGAIAPLFPRQHRLTDVYPAVVNDVCLHNAVAVGLHNLGQRPSEEVVSHVSKVQRLVGIGRRILYHHEWRLLVNGLFAETRFAVDAVEQADPRRRCNGEVEKTLHHVETLHHFAVLCQIIAQLLGGVFGFQPRQFKEWEHHEREVSLKLGLCLLQLNHRCWHVLAKTFFHRLHHGCYYLAFNIHAVVFRFFCKQMQR